MPKRQDQGGWPDTGFSYRLKELRQAAGLTQAELAERAACNKFTVAKFEAGKQVPAWPLVLALAEALGVDCTALMSDGDRLSTLLLRWEELSEQGKPISPEELCRDSPELLPALRERIKKLSTQAPESVRPQGSAAERSPVPPQVSGPTGETARLLDPMRATTVVWWSEPAGSRLITHACERLRHLAIQMLKGFPNLGRQVQADDVLNSALLRLRRALAGVSPESSRHFWDLAALQIRRELLDLARHCRGPEGHGAKSHTDEAGKAADGAGGPLTSQPDRTGVPHSLEEWVRFHEAAGDLPGDEREVFNLIWYGGLTQEDVAALLGTSLRTAKRRWQSARLLLARGLSGDPPR